MRTGVTLSITSADLERLRALVGDRNAPQKHVWRARIVLLSGEVLGTNAIMRETGKSKTCVWRWQERSPRRAQRLLRDKTRPSRIPKLDTAIAERGVALTMEPPLAEAQAFPMDRRPRQNHRRRPTRVPNVRFDPLAPVQGVTFPTPDGGKYRQIVVDIDPLKLQARGLTPADIVNAVNAQNLTLPSGLAKIGNTQYTVRTNAMPTTIDELNDIPIKYINGQTVYVKDVGQVHDGWAVQQNIVRNDGRRSVLLSVIKNGNASTVAVVNGVRKVLQGARESAPPGLSINELFDQSKLVTASIAGVVREGGIDSPVDPDVDCRPILHGPHAQHH